MKDRLIGRRCGSTLKVGELITDPIQRHVKRRLVRQREKIHEGVEASCSSPKS